ncbi:Uncharacterised protein [Vibrio cholerae]|nr:Uncharacterised protein [Vibrio cholerae]
MAQAKRPCYVLLRVLESVSVGKSSGNGAKFKVTAKVIIKTCCF